MSDHLRKEFRTTRCIKPGCNHYSAVGQRYCLQHGGRRGYAKALGEGKLGILYEQFANQESPLELLDELALQRTMLAEVLEKASKLYESNGGNLSANTISCVMALTNQITTTARTMSVIMNNLKDSVHVEDIRIVTDQIVMILQDLKLPDDIIDRAMRALYDISIPTRVIDVASNSEEPEEEDLDPRDSLPSPMEPDGEV